MRTTRKWLPVVDPTRCTGCGRCVRICGLQLREIVAGVSVLRNLVPCPSEELCVVACPIGAIRMTWVDIPVSDGDAV